MLYLHIGIPRTASTFLQNVVFPAVTGVKYVRNPDVMHAMQDCLCSQRLSEETKAVLHSVSQSAIPVLISSEAFSMEPWKQSYPSQTVRLQHWLPNAEIIVFLRDPVDWVLSLYGLAVQKRRYISLKDFLGWDGENFNYHEEIADRKKQISLKKLSFTRILDIWSKGFTSEHVHVYFYENLVNRPESELRRLCNLIGVTFPEHLDLGRRRNSSPTPKRCDAAAAVYSYLGYLDRFTVPWHISHKLGPEIARHITSGKIPFPKILVRSHRDEIRAALEFEFMEDKEKITEMYSDCPW